MDQLGSKQEIIDLLAKLEPQKILILPHVRSDPDALGSASGLAQLLSQLGHHTKILVDEPAGDHLDFIYRGLDLEVFELEQEKNQPGPDLIVYIDHHGLDRLGQRGSLLGDFPGRPLLIVDHHPLTQTDSQDFYRRAEFAGRRMTCWIDSQRSSVSEMIADLFLTLLDQPDLLGFSSQARRTGTNKACLDLDEQTATALMAGIYGDTGGLRFANTRPETFYICSRLFRDGMSIDFIADKLFGEKSLAQVRLAGQVFEGARLNTRGNLIWFYASQDFLRAVGCKTDDLEGLCSDMRNLENIDLAILIRETEEGDLRVNLRSNQNFDCQALAEMFGGGGHVRASGISFCQPEHADEIINRLVAAAEKLLDEVG